MSKQVVKGYGVSDINQYGGDEQEGMIIVKTILFIAFMLIVVCSSPVYADSGEMDLPSSQEVYTYSSVPEPVLSTDPSSAKQTGQCGRSFTEHVGMASPSMEWDPDVAVDNKGVIHLSFMTYRPEGSITIDYQRSEDRGLTWSGQTTLSEAISRFPFWVPDNKNNLLWLFWKDESDISGKDNRKADVAAKYSADSGLTWSSIEFVTNLGDIEVKFPSPALGPDGRTHVTWSDERYGSSSRVFLKSRTVSPLQ